jgi:hypothetical protein
VAVSFLAKFAYGFELNDSFPVTRAIHRLFCLYQGVQFQILPRPRSQRQHRRVVAAGWLRSCSRAFGLSELQHSIECYLMAANSFIGGSAEIVDEHGYVDTVIDGGLDRINGRFPV